MNAPRDVSHDEAVVAMLKADPDFANEYLAAAWRKRSYPGGKLRYWASRSHWKRMHERRLSPVLAYPAESLYRALSPKGNPTIKTFLAVVRGAGLHLDVSRESAHA